VVVDDAIDHHNECAGRTADLHPAAAERRDQEASNNRSDQASCGRSARRDGNGDAQRQCDERNGHTGKGIRAKLTGGVADNGRENLWFHRMQLRQSAFTIHSVLSKSFGPFRVHLGYGPLTRFGLPDICQSATIVLITGVPSRVL
jgi:hypothetical protein